MTMSRKNVVHVYSVKDGAGKYSEVGVVTL